LCSFSLREKVRMRGLFFIYSLTPALSLRERGLLVMVKK